MGMKPQPASSQAWDGVWALSLPRGAPPRPLGPRPDTGIGGRKRRFSGDGMLSGRLGSWSRAVERGLEMPDQRGGAVKDLPESRSDLGRESLRQQLRKAGRDVRGRVVGRRRFFARHQIPDGHVERCRYAGKRPQRHVRLPSLDLGDPTGGASYALRNVELLEPGTPTNLTHACSDSDGKSGLPVFRVFYPAFRHRLHLLVQNGAPDNAHSRHRHAVLTRKPPAALCVPATFMPRGVNRDQSRVPFAPWLGTMAGQ